MAEGSFKRRGRHDIILQILENAKEGARKTSIMFEARLSYSQLEKYLNHLKAAGFITEKSDIWQTTEKGFHVIEACKICQRLMKEAQ
jgi:predicted transcriptional regulator